MEKYKNRNRLSAEYLLAAMKEKDITAEEVAAELNIILEDYFMGSVTLNGESIKITFLNGQSFCLTVKKA
ncbi:MAG: hypothetical protein K2I30_00200 [Clostridia bacterium]|nr:hypothetical protein [Clostridia bacterium]